MLEDLFKLPRDELAQFLERADDAYYNSGDALLGDDDYDRLKEHFCSKWPTHRICKKVGHTPAAKVKLPCWMGSLDKLKKIDKWQETYPGPYVVSDKLDGLSALVVFENGAPTMLLTRGDGSHGEDASFILPYIHGIPSKVKTDIKFVRGELVLPRLGYPKNSRAIIVGAVNAKQNVRQDILRAAHFVAYELTTVNAAQDTATDQLQKLRHNGFDVAWNDVLQDLDDLSQVLSDRRDNSPYHIDGIVVTDNSKAHPRPTKGNPSYAFAFKNILTQEMAEVVVNDVTWEVSKDKYMIPTVVYQPVELGGVVLKKATGHNAKFIHDNVIGPGARIIVVRSGDVIPYIFKVLTPASNGKPKMPIVQYTWNDTGVDIITEEGSDDHTIRCITFFFETIGTRGLSLKTISKIYNSGVATSVPDFLKLKQEDLMRVDGFKETLAAKTVASIQRAMRDVTVAKLMVASNAFGRGFGEKKIQVIVDNFPNIQSITTEKLMLLDGFAEKTAQQFVENVPEFMKFFESINNGLALRFERPVDNADGPLVGKSVAFSGFRDKALEDHVRAMGGKIASSVTKQTTWLVVKDGDDSESTKVTTARKYDVKVIPLNEFLRLVKYGP